MNTSTILLAVLAVSVASAFPLAGEAFAQATTVTIETDDAKVTGPNLITIKFSEAVDVDRSSFGNFTHGGGDLADGTGFSANSYTDAAKERTTEIISGDGTDTIVLRFSGAHVGTAASGTLDIREIPSRADSDVVFSAVGSQTVVDGQAPKIKSAKIIDPASGDNNARAEIIFTEALVGIPNLGSFTDFKISSTDLTSPAPKGFTVRAGDTQDIVMLTILGGPIPLDATATVDVQAILRDVDGSANTPDIPVSLGDAANNAFETVNDYPVMAGQIPEIVSAKFTAPTTVTITFSEDLRDDITNANFPGLTVTEGIGLTGPRPIAANAALDTTDTDTVLLTIQGYEVPTDGIGTVGVVSTLDDEGKATTLRDLAGNPPKQDNAYPITDGQPPTIKSAEITGPTEVTIKFSEAVNIPRNTFLDFVLTAGMVNHNGEPKILADSTLPTKPTGTNSIDSIQVDGNTAVLTVDLGLGVTMRTDASGTIDINSATDAEMITDMADNKLAFAASGGFSDGDEIPVAPGQAPTIEDGYPKITGPTTVVIKFSEPMHDTNAVNVAHYTFKVKGESVNRIISNAELGSDDAVNTVTLTIGGANIDASRTGTLDIAKMVTSVNDISVGDGLKGLTVHAAQYPTVVSAKVTEPDTITVVFSEAVKVTRSQFGDFMLTAGTGITSTAIPIKELHTVDPSDSSTAAIDNRTAVGDLNTLFVTHALKLADGTELPTDAVGTIKIAKELLDTDGNNLKNNIPRQPVTDGQSPNIISAEITTPKTITIIFTEKIYTKPDTFSDLQIASSSKNVRTHTGNGTNTIMLTTTGSAMPATVDGTIKLTVPGGEIVDTSGNPLAHTTEQQGARASNDSILNAFPITAGQTPKVTYAKITDPITVEIKFSIPVDASSDDFTNFKILGENTTRAIASFHPSADKTIVTLKIGPNANGQGMPVDAMGTIDIAVTGSDSGVPYEKVGRPVAAGQAPTVLSAKITGPDEVTINFSDNVTTSFTHFKNFKVTQGTIMAGSNVTIGTVIPVTAGSTSNSNSTVLTIGGGNDAVNVALPPDAIGTIDITELIVNYDTKAPLKALSNHPVTDGYSPTVLSAKVTDSNTVTIKFSEAVIAERMHFNNTMIGPEGELQPRNVTKIDGSRTNTIILTVNGTVADNDVGEVDILDRITDLAGNKLVENDGVSLTGYELTAGQAPSVESAVITGPNHITITFSEPVNADTGHFTDLKISYDGNTPQTPNIAADDTIDQIRSINDISDTPSDTITLTVDGSEFVPGTTGVIAISDRITDNAGNNLVPESEEQDLTSIQIAPDAGPSIESFEITGPNELTVKFSEPVRATSGDFAGFKSSYITSDGMINHTRNVKTINPSSGLADIFTLTVDRAPMPTNATGIIFISSSLDPTPADPTARTMTDNTGNLLTNLFVDYDNDPTTAPTYDDTKQVEVPVTDGQPEVPSDTIPPTLVSAKITGPTMVTVTFSEPVTAMAAYFDFTLADEVSPREISASPDTASDTMTLTVGGNDMLTSATGILNVTGMVKDAAGNAIEQKSYAVMDGQAPTLMDGYPKITASDTVMIMFSEPVITVAQHFDNFMLTSEGNTRDITNLMGSSTDTITLTVDGTPMPTNATGTIDISMVKDFSYNMFEDTGIPVSDGQADKLVRMMGILLSQSGDFASQGEETIKAAEKAVVDFNMWLTENNKEWKLEAGITEIPTTPAADALTKIQEFNATGIDVVVGVPTSAMVQETKSFIDTEKMVLVSCCSTSPELEQVDNIFRMVPSDSGQAPLLAEHIRQTHTDIVIVYRNDTWGKPLNSTLTEIFEEMGGSVLDSIPYNATSDTNGEHSVDFFTRDGIVRDAVDAIGTNTSAALVFLGWSETANFMTASSETVLADLTWFGSGDSVNDEAILKPEVVDFATKTNFSAVQFAANQTETTRAVEAHVNSVLKRSPSVYAYSTYDAVWVAGLAMDMANSTMGAEVKENIMAAAESRGTEMMNNIPPGAIGSNQLNKYGDLALNNYRLWAVEDGMWKDKGQLPMSDPDAPVMTKVTGTVFYDSDGDGMMTDDDDRPAEAYTAMAIGADAQPYQITVNADGTIEGFKMYAVESNGERTLAITGSDGTYSLDITPGDKTIVQTAFFPAGHTVHDPASSWAKRITLDAGEADKFDIGFRQTQEDEFVTLNLTVFVDENDNGTPDPGEGPEGLALFHAYEYTIGPKPIITFDASGTATIEGLVPANFTVVALGWPDMLTEAGYQIVKATPFPAVIVNPDPGSTHTMVFELARLP